MQYVKYKGFWVTERLQPDVFMELVQETLGVKPSL